MIDIITYQTINPHNPNYTWLAYVVLPNGEFWNIRFNGATEDIVRHRAASLWEKESDKVLAHLELNPKPTDKSPCVDPWAELPIQPKSEKIISGLGRGSHLRGKTWMLHEETRELIAVTLTEITMYEERGYVRGGPRSK